MAIKATTIANFTHYVSQESSAARVELSSGDRTWTQSLHKDQTKEEKDAIIKELFAVAMREAPRIPNPMNREILAESPEGTFLLPSTAPVFHLKALAIFEGTTPEDDAHGIRILGEYTIATARMARSSSGPVDQI